LNPFNLEIPAPYSARLAALAESAAQLGRPTATADILADVVLCCGA